MKTTEDTEYTEKDYPDSGLTDKIIRCAIEVHKILGPGFLESVYEKALVYELRRMGLKVEEQKVVPIPYKDTVAGEHRLNLLVEKKIIVENKTVKAFDENHMAQILSYLKASKMRVGLLFNFAKTKIEVKRFIL